MADPSQNLGPVEQAIAIAGSEAKLAKACGYTQNAVWAAKRRGIVSAEMAVAIDRFTNGKVSRAALRPDLFGPEAAA